MWKLLDAAEDGAAKLGFFHGPRRMWSIIIIALMSGILLGAVFSGMLLLHPSTASNSNGARNQGLVVSGTETVKVIGPDGRVVSTWTGPDPLSVNAFDAIASCVTGISNPGPGGVFGSCSGWMSGMYIQTDTPGHICNDGPDQETYCTFLTAPVSNTLTPVGCSTGSSSAYGSCSGWITEATFGPTSFTSANCGASCNVENVAAGCGNPASTGCTYSALGVYPFDSICSADFNYAGFTPLPCMSGEIATVQPLDSLLVTITFTIS